MKVNVNLGVPVEEEEEEEEVETEVEAVEVFSATGLGDMATTGRGSLAFFNKEKKNTRKEKPTIAKKRH